MVESDPADLVCTIRTCHFDGELVEVWLSRWTNKRNKREIIQALLQILRNLLEIGICWFQEIKSREAWASFPFLIDVRMQDYVTVPEVSYLKDWSDKMLYFVIIDQNLKSKHTFVNRVIISSHFYLLVLRVIFKIIIRAKCVVWIWLRVYKVNYIS